MNETAHYFDTLADEWESTLCTPSPVQGAVARIAGVGPHSRVLDLGCGTGVMAETYAACEAAEVVALDVAPRMIEIAQQKYKNDHRFSFLCRDVYEFDDDQGFDAVVIYNAYPHFIDRAALVRKVASLCRQGGRFVVAHSMGRETLNAHHHNVPHQVTSNLAEAAEESQFWSSQFTIDALVDTPTFYCISGVLSETNK